MRTALFFFIAICLTANMLAGAAQNEEPTVIRGQSCEQNMACSQPALNVSPIASIRASSVLENKKTYAADNAIDADPEGPDDMLYGNLNTAWCEGDEDTGEGAFIRIAFDEPVAVSAIRLSAGYDKSADLFAKNSRLKKARLVLSNRAEFVLHFGEHFFDMENGDTSWKPMNTRGTIPNSPQLFRIVPHDAAPVRISWLMLVIEETVPGWKYRDTCISTIDLIEDFDD